MDRWYLTAHLKANVASTFFSMLGLDDENQSSVHKESTIRRTENGDKFINSMISVTEERMLNPFQIESEWTVEEPKHLCNIATGLLASSKVVTWASTIERNGRKQLDDFITKRLSLQEEEFFEPITKTKICSLHRKRKKPKLKGMRK